MPATFYVNGIFTLDFLSSVRVLQLIIAAVFTTLLFLKPRRTDLLNLFLILSITIQLMVTIFYEDSKSLMAYNFIPILVFISAVVFTNDFKSWLIGNFSISFLAILIPIFFKHFELRSNVSSFLNNYLFSFFALITSTLLVFIFSIQKKFHEKLQTELEEQARKLKDEFAQIEKLKIQLEIGDMILKVAHDIRSPLAALETLISCPSGEDLSLAKDAITRIKGIANSLLDKGRNNEAIFNDIQEISPSIEWVIKSKKLEFPNRNIMFENEAVGELALFNNIVLESILSNIINNAIEASEEIVPLKIACKIISDNIEIKLSDKGRGIDQDTLASLGQEKITSKSKGNGIGIYSAKKELEKINSKIHITSVLGQGTTVTIVIPKQHKAEERIVLLDDDNLVRLTWESKAKKKGVYLDTFANPEELNINLKKYTPNTIFYIDSELGEIPGEEFAASLFNRGFKNISMATGHEASKFKEYSFLRSVISKSPPF